MALESVVVGEAGSRFASARENEAKENTRSTGKPPDGRYSRKEVLKRLGLSGTALQYRQTLAGVEPLRKGNKGELFYTEEDVLAIEKVTSTSPRSPTTVIEKTRNIASKVFKAYVEGKSRIEVVVLELASPREATELYEQYVSMLDGAMFNGEQWAKLSALLGKPLGGVDEGLEAVAELVARAKDVKALPAPKFSTAMPKCWDEEPWEKDDEARQS